MSIEMMDIIERKKFTTEDEVLFDALFDKWVEPEEELPF